MWSARAGEPLVGDEGALRLGGDPAADAARLRAAGVDAEVLDAAGARQPALAPDAGPLLWDPRGGAIRAARTIEWLCAELGDRVQRGAVRRVDPVRRGAVALEVDDGAIRAARVVLLAYAAAAFPGLGAPVDEIVRLLTALPGDDEDAYRVDADGRLVVAFGHNLFKLVPLLGEKVADAIM